MLRQAARFALGAALVMAAPAAAHPSHPSATPRAAAIAATASAFVAALSPAQRAQVVRRFDDDAARTNWSNLPSNLYARDGLAVGELSPAQRIAFHDLLAAALSSQGYAKTATIMWLEDILRAEETERLKTADLPPERKARVEQLVASRRSGNYWITMFGTPDDARWGWLVSGHHLAASFTIADGRVAFTPLFLGAEPQLVKEGAYAGWRVLDHEIARGFAILRSLDADQRRAAVLADTVGNDLFTGKGRKDSLKAPVGLPAARMTQDQQRLLMGLVREFVGVAADEAADVQMAAIERDGLAKLHFAWWGPTDDPAKRFMYRIHGPSILIEYVRENRGGQPGNHVHAIVRDPGNDYGEDWLAKHYREQPHP